MMTTLHLKKFVGQSNPTLLHNKKPRVIIATDLTVKYLHRKSIGNKTSEDMILLKSFPRACCKSIRHYIMNSDLDKTPDLVIIHGNAKNLQS